MRTIVPLVVFGLAACGGEQPPTVDDPGAAGRCTVEQAAACSTLEACGLDGEPSCSCAAGYVEDAGICAEPCASATEPYEPVAVKFVSPDGVKPQDCSGGTREAPWSDIGQPSLQGCLEPGTDIVLLEGDYVSRDVFGGSLTVSGTAERPIRILGDPDSADPFPARIKDQVFIIGRGVTLERLDIRQTPGDNGVMVLGEHIVIRDSWVHGTGGRSGKDCIKILSQGQVDGQEIRVRDVLVENSLIEDCPEDAIDVTGARGVVYRGNTLRRAKLMQVKGGTEDVLIEDNRFEDMEFGVAGFSMSCGVYCGSPVLPLLPLDQRFVARNVVIRNNTFTRIERNAILANGWADAIVTNNTFREVGGVSFVGEDFGNDYTDEIAWEACAERDDCTPCLKRRRHCRHFTTSPRGVLFANNLIVGGRDRQVELSEGAEDVVFRSNLWTVQPTFSIGEQSFDLDDFPLDEGGIRGDEALAAGAGVEMGLCEDLTDIGAM